MKSSSRRNFAVKLPNMKERIGWQWLALGSVIHKWLEANASDPKQAWRDSRCAALTGKILSDVCDSQQFRVASVVTVGFSAPAWFPSALSSLFTRLTDDIKVVHRGLFVPWSGFQALPPEVAVIAQAHSFGGWHTAPLAALQAGALTLCNISKQSAEAEMNMPCGLGGFVSLADNLELAQALKSAGAQVLFIAQPAVAPRAAQPQHDAELREFLKGGQLSWPRMLKNPLGRQYDLVRERIVGPTDPLHPRMHPNPRSLVIEPLSSHQFQQHIKQVLDHSPHIGPHERAQDQNIVHLSHLPSAGATTLCRRVLFNLRVCVPCVHLSYVASVTAMTVAQQLGALATFSQSAVLVLVDGKLFSGAFMDDLAHSCRQHSVFFLRTRQTVSKHTPTRALDYFLGYEMTETERTEFKDVFRVFLSPDAATQAAFDAAHCSIFFGLVAFFDDYRDRMIAMLESQLATIDSAGRRMLLFIAFVAHYTDGKLHLPSVFFKLVIEAVASGTPPAISAAASLNLFECALLSADTRFKFRMLLLSRADGSFCLPVHHLVVEPAEASARFSAGSERRGQSR